MSYMPCLLGSAALCQGYHRGITTGLYKVLCSSIFLISLLDLQPGSAGVLGDCRQATAFTKSPRLSMDRQCAPTVCHLTSPSSHRTWSRVFLLTSCVDGIAPGGASAPIITTVPTETSVKCTPAPRTAFQRYPDVSISM